MAHLSIAQVRMAELTGSGCSGPGRPIPPGYRLHTHRYHDDEVEAQAMGPHVAMPASQSPLQAHVQCGAIAVAIHEVTTS
jgi:hypothetical protein